DTSGGRAIKGPAAGEVGTRHAQRPTLRHERRISKPDERRRECGVPHTGPSYDVPGLPVVGHGGNYANFAAHSRPRCGLTGHTSAMDAITRYAIRAARGVTASLRTPPYVAPGHFYSPATSAADRQRAVT